MTTDLSMSEPVARGKTYMSGDSYALKVYRLVDLIPTSKVDDIREAISKVPYRDGVQIRTPSGIMGQQRRGVCQMVSNETDGYRYSGQIAPAVKMVDSFLPLFTLFGDQV